MLESKERKVFQRSPKREQEEGADDGGKVERSVWKDKGSAGERFHEDRRTGIAETSIVDRVDKLAIGSSRYRKQYRQCTRQERQRGGMQGLSRFEPCLKRAHVK
ncbi:UNVERIFIED_CONTAM: hypothetical protein FKN15_005220 [Acipenser sinensis]